MNRVDLTGLTEVQECEYAFLDDVESVVLADGIESIGGRAFASNPRLREVIWKGTVYNNVDTLVSELKKDCVTVGEHVFENTALLELGNFRQLTPGLYDERMEIVCGWNAACVVVRNGVLSIVGEVLDMQQMLKKRFPTVRYISLPEGIDSIYYNAFAGCNKLKGIVLPERLFDIGEYAFKDCASLEMVSIPSSLTHIGRDTFLGCEWLHEFLWRDRTYNCVWDEMKLELAREGVRIL